MEALARSDMRGGGGIRLGSEMAEHARVVELQQPYAIYERTSSHFLY